MRFWTAKSFEAYCGNLAGETDGLATQQRKPGRSKKSESNQNRHQYLENMDGSAVPREILVKVGQRARRLWQSLNTAGVAPSSWGKASEHVYKYFNSEMLSDPEFQFFRYCDGNWKLMRWAAKAYSSWTHNHIKPSNAGENKTPRTTKRKHDPLDDPLLLQIDDDDDKEDNTSLSNPTAVENHSDPPISPAPSGSALVPTQVRPNHLYKCFAEYR